MSDVPKKSASDHTHAIIRGALSAIPVVGGPLAIIFETVFSAPIDKRREEWISSLSIAIDELTKNVDGLSPEALSKNEAFISVAMQATQIALRNHQQEKIAALKNAVINTVLDKSIDENKALIFTRIIDEITPLHIIVLAFLNKPEDYEKELQAKTRPTFIHYPNNMSIFEAYYPELGSSSSLVRQVIKELYAKGFLYFESAHMGNSKVTTEFGQEFLAFISPTDKA